MAFPIKNKAFVVVQHNFNSAIRIDENLVDAHGNGSGQYARWRLHYCGIKKSSSSNSTRIIHQIKLESAINGKYLRIYRTKDNKNKIDVCGLGGHWTLFNCHKINNSYILESNQLPGTFLYVNKINKSILSNKPRLLNNNINTINKAYHFKIIALPQPGSQRQMKNKFHPRPKHFTSKEKLKQDEDEKAEIEGKLNSNNIKNGGIYMIGHTFKNHLGINPNNKTGIDADSKAGRGKFARWKVHVLPDRTVKFQSLVSQKYLRICGNGNKVDIGGSGGQYTIFKLKQGKNNCYFLESNLFNGKFLGVKKDDNNVYSVEINDKKYNDKISMVFKLTKINIAPSVASVRPRINVCGNNKQFGGTIESQKLSERKTGFDLPYLFHQNNLVMFSHFNNDHRNVRVVPKDGYKFVDGNGSSGPITQWIVKLEGNNIVKLQNAHSKGYLRICGNKDNLIVDARGGSTYTRLKVHFLEKRNIVKLESISFPGNFIGIRNNNLRDTFVVKNNENNNECKFEFKRTINGPKKMNEILGNHKTVKEIKYISKTKGHGHGHGDNNTLITQQSELIAQQNKIIQDLQSQLTNQNKIIMKQHEKIGKILLQEKGDLNTFGGDEGNNESPGCQDDNNNNKKLKEKKKENEDTRVISSTLGGNSNIDDFGYIPLEDEDSNNDKDDDQDDDQDEDGSDEFQMIE